MARGHKITVAQKQAYIGLLVTGLSYGGAAKELGLGERSFRDLRQADEAFAVACDTAYRNEGAHVFEDQLKRYALGEDPIKNAAQVTACFGALKARQPEKWRENQRVDIGNANGKPFRTEGEGTSLREILALAKKLGIDKSLPGTEPERDAGSREALPAPGDLLPAG